VPSFINDYDFVHHSDLHLKEDQLCFERKNLNQKFLKELKLLKNESYVDEEKACDFNHWINELQNGSKKISTDNSCESSEMHNFLSENKISFTNEVRSSHSQMEHNDFYNVGFDFKKKAKH